MKTFAWITDPHLDHTTPSQRRSLFEGFAELDVAGFLVGGDIGEASTAAAFLEEFGAAVERPVFFVLGNHDYYRGSISEVRKEMAALTRRSPWCRWLPEAGALALGEETALVGNGGWGDGRCGDFMSSSIMLNDYLLIGDLVTDSKSERMRRLQALGQEAATALRADLEAALEMRARVVLLTHVPPFVEACWHEGQATLNEWTPHFTCGAVGDLLISLMEERPEHHLEVFCGHTHSSGRAELLPNLNVTTGGAVYGSPMINAFLEIA